METHPTPATPRGSLTRGLRVRIAAADRERIDAAAAAADRSASWIIRRLLREGLDQLEADGR